jgi:DNA-binding response OmpR family regulator
MTTDSSSPPSNTITRLLVVDDEPHIRSPLTRALTFRGYLVEEVASGQEALVLLEQTRYDLMILDLLMPDVSGVEVMQQARRIQPHLMIIILTGHATLESAITAVKTEAVDYLLKPASTHDIIKAITQALHKRADSLRREELIQLMSESLDILRQPASVPPTSRPSDMKLHRFVTAYPLRLDRQNRAVTSLVEPVRTIELTKGETIVLADLMTHSGQVRSCQQVVRAGWGYDEDKKGAESVVRPYISRLRGKLEVNPKKPRLILTVRRRGYLFVTRTA